MPKLSEQCHIQGLDGKWVDLTEYQGCCDCGLMHRMEYAVQRLDGSMIPIGEYKLVVRAYREEGLTSEARATKVFKCTPKEESK